METGLAGRGALVGGASKGLGRAVADALAAEGCRLLLWSRGGPALEEAAAEIRSMYGVEVHTVGADAGDPFTAGIVADVARGALGHIDVLILNSGGPPTVDPTHTEPEAWNAALQLLVVTPIILATHLLPEMRERRWGRIVSILSSVIRHPAPDLVYSSACRSALASWLTTIAPLVAEDGVTVNGVLPGRLDTERVAALDQIRADREGMTLAEVRAASQAAIPARRYGRPEELASLVTFLCSEGAGYQTGTFISVDGGSMAGF